MIEVKEEGMKIPKVEYDVYSQLSSNKLEKLNLSVCQKDKIIISIPVELNEHIDKLNIKSGYYNDACYKATSDDGTDITLRDRKNEFIDGNKTLCQEDCDFSDYNYTTHKVSCSCQVKVSYSSVDCLNINKTKLLENLKNIKNIANVKILVCYRILFILKSFSMNIGNYIISAILIFHIIALFVFFIKKVKLIYRNIGKIISDIKQKIDENNLIEDRIKKNKNPKKKKKKSKKNKNNIFQENNDESTKGRENDNIKKNKSNLRNVLNLNLSNPPKRRVSLSENQMETNDITKSKGEKIKDKLFFIDEEINLLPYKLALEYDKRSYCKYYLSLLKTNHNLIFTFCNNKDYNSQIIKIDLFFIGFATEYTINALFYNDDLIHQIYVSKGDFDLEYQLPKILYSSGISFILDILLKLLALSNDEIIEFKQNKEIKDFKKEGKKLKKKLKIKFFLYFILSFFVLLFFWYYITLFGAIYANTQYHLLKDTLISFGLSLVYPFGFYLLPGLFRITSLSNSQNKKECLYNFSKILQMF